MGQPLREKLNDREKESGSSIGIRRSKHRFLKERKGDGVCSHRKDQKNSAAAGGPGNQERALAKRGERKIRSKFRQE